MCGKFNKKKLLSVLAGLVLLINNGAALADIFNVDSEASITGNGVNFRLGPGRGYEIIHRLDKGDSVRVLFNDGDWDFAYHDGLLGYVSHDYVSQTYESSNPSHNYVEDRDVVVTTKTLNFRLQPNTNNNNKPVYVLPKGFEIETIALVDNEWYLVRCDGKLGYINKEFTRSLRSAVQAYYPDAENIEIISVGAVKHDISITNSNGKTVSIPYPHVVNILRQDHDYYLISYEGNVGYVAKRDIEKVKGEFVVVDKSDQRFYYGQDTQNLISSKASTGKRGYETPEEMDDIDSAERDRTFTKANVTVGYAFQYHDNYFIHSYEKQPESDFGTPQSHGCTRIPTSTAARFYEYMDSNHDGVLDNPNVRVIVQK